MDFAAAFCTLLATGIISVDPIRVSSEAAAALPAGSENARAAAD